MASSSSSSGNPKSYQYDVFLSFSGEDTRRSFVDHLNDALQRQGIRTFKDDERLQKGKEIKEELLKSIDDSRFSLVVFSKKYASSSWCLDELVKIMECQDKNDQTVFPVFFDVEPTEVRKQSGSVGEAFAKHTKKVVVGTTLTRNIIGKPLARHSNKKLGKWRKSLKDAANLSGWELKNTADGHEAKVIKSIVERISLELRSINMGVDDNLVGMEQRMQDLDPYLDIGSNDVRMIGIKGMGGAGKTTLACAIFYKISIHFEGKSFVENVREKTSMSGLEKMQEQVLQDVLKDKDITVPGVHEGENLMKNRLHGKKVLLIFDDVDHKDQLEMLAGDLAWFKPGSRIIITTRDEQVLKAHRVKYIHDVNLLTKEEAIRLFSRHAFGKDIPTKDYEKHSLEVVSYAAGLPLTIKVLGSDLCGKDASEWADVLKRLKTIPLKETLKILELSYENLEDDHKEIFLDVACFLRYWEKDDAIRMLESCGFYAKVGLRVLEQKSLIKTSKDSYFRGPSIQMHDHLVEMGKNIVCREHTDEPNKRSRLWVREEVEHILSSDLVNETTRYIKLETTPHIALERLGNMKTLKCLIVNYYPYYPRHVEIKEARIYFPNSLQYLYWSKYPHWHLPKTFEANNLVGLEMPHSNIKQLWKGGKVMKKLKFLNLSCSKTLRSLDLGMTPNLEWLDLQYCFDLEEVYVDGGCLRSLIYLNLNFCVCLKWRVFLKQFESLEVIHMKGLNTMELMDHIFTGHSNNSLLELLLTCFHSYIEVPSSIGNLHKLVSLTLYNVKSLPGSICTLRHLRSLDLQLSTIEELPEDLDQLECLENLDLSGSYFERLPRNVCMLKRLKILFLRACKNLEKLHENIGQLESLKILDLFGCYNLREIPNNICKLKRLKHLNLEECWSLEKVVEGVGDLERLQLLNIKSTRITHLPPNIHLLKGLKIIYTSELADTPGSTDTSDDDFNL